MENHNFSWGKLGKLTISMVIFNSYVQVPEGGYNYSTCLITYIQYLAGIHTHLLEYCGIYSFEEK